MVSFSIGQPLPKAIAQLSGRTPLGIALNSAEWDRVAVDIKLRSMFSATVLDEQILGEMQSRLVQNISHARSLLAGGAVGTHMDRGRFIEEMRALLTQAGYKRGEAKRGSLQDLKSIRRLSLIWQMNLDQALGFSAWKSSQSAVALKMWPCMEFVRLEARKEPRDWPAIWQDHGGQFYGEPGADYPNAPGRMLALRNDPIWPEINRFGVPWKPFDWGSGMGTRNVARDMSIRLGVITGDEPPQLAQEVPFNSNYQMSVADVPPAGRERILDALAGDVSIAGDVISLLPDPVIPAVFTAPELPAELHEAQAQAVKVISELSADDLAKAMQPIRSTVADMRLRAAAVATGSELSDASTVGRALMQWFAMDSGLGSVIRSLRQGDLRDWFWSLMDFRPIAAFFQILLGGQS